MNKIVNAFELWRVEKKENLILDTYKKKEKSEAAERKIRRSERKQESWRHFFFDNWELASFASREQSINETVVVTRINRGKLKK